MRKLKRFFSHLLVVLLALQGTVAAQFLSASSAQAASANPTVAINEVMWMGSIVGGVQKDADEWIELRNTTSEAIDLTGWTLTNAGASGTDLVIPSGVIPANGYFLIGNYDADDANSILNVEPDYPTTSIALGNTCSAIDLIKPGETEPVDTMGCNGTSYFAGINGSTRQSMERNLGIADGTLSSSWHTALGAANLDDTATIANKATPKATNDTTGPIASSATVSDLTSLSGVTDVDWTTDPSTLFASWTGFTDSETTINAYQMSVATDPAGPFTTWTDVGLTASGSVSMSLVEDTTYYVAVRAQNSVGIWSDPVVSDGVTLNTSDPEAPTNLTAVDVANDNGGHVRVSWDASTSADTVAYELSYRKTGTSTWTTVNVGSLTETVIAGLENAPTTYQFRVEAVDFNDQHSAASSTVSAQALDNVAPQLDITKVVVSQNRPGTNDTVVGTVGVSSEAGATVSTFDRDPASPGAVLINSVMVNADGSFAALSIGNNAYGQVWLQLTDASGNASQAHSFANDITGPNAPALESVKTHCLGDPCRVTVTWKDNGPDTVHYQVAYTTDGVTQRTREITTTSIALDLPVEKSYQFTVYAFDAAGNESLSSNNLTVRLTRGVATSAVIKDGQVVVTTAGIASSRLVSSAVAPSKGGFLVPPAKAAEETPKAEDQAPSANANDSDKNGKENGTRTAQDWLRIAVIVLLLLVIAGSLWALSRSVERGGQPVKEKPARAEQKPTKRRNRRRGGRRR